jgi:lipopolysaccharide transport system permease protein
MQSLKNFLIINWSSRSLIKQLVIREIATRYRGSVFGIAWSLLLPLSLLSVYTFVFMGVFGAKWPQMKDKGGFEFAIQIFVGLSIFNIFGEMVQRSPSLLSENPNLIKKVVFPVETLITVVMGNSLFHYGIQLIILLIAVLLMDFSLYLSFILIPIFIIPLCLFTSGLGLIFSSIGIYIKDLRLLVGSLLTLLLFISPVFFAIQTVKDPLRQWLTLNPLAMIITNVRSAIFFPQELNWHDCVATYVIGLTTLIVGTWIFYRLKPGFADVV